MKQFLAFITFFEEGNKWCVELQNSGPIEKPRRRKSVRTVGFVMVWSSCTSGAFNAVLTVLLCLTVLDFLKKNNQRST